MFDEDGSIIALLLGRMATGARVQSARARRKTCRSWKSSVMRRIGGRCQRGVRRALWVLGTASTQQIVEWAYGWPGESRRQRKNRARAVNLAARKMAVVVGRVWPGGNVWRLKDGQ